jgi:hypothetical protein
MQADKLLPLSILAGSTIIGAGLYLGLRERGAPPPAETAPPPIAPAPVPVTPQETVIQQATQALEAQRAELLRLCWTPAVQKTPEPSKAVFRYNMSFDPQGRQVSLGISEIRGESRTDVAQCLRSRPVSLRIPPPGAFANVDVMLAFP